MLNKLCNFLQQHAMVQPGDRVVCAVSGGADSVALLFGMYLLKNRLSIHLEAAHFNHHLRGEESDRDERFVRQLCSTYDIPLHVGGGQVVSGKKGLEAAAREARYRFFDTLPGKIATAHTANDNAETVLMHMVRGTGLRGLGGIHPVNGRLIRPMLEVTRQEVMDFLEEYHLRHITDSSNETDAFLRNRLRHHILPLLEQENPRLVENLSAMALRLRRDDAALDALSPVTTEVAALRNMEPALRSRSLDRLLKQWGIPEPEAEHICLAEKLVFSENPSAKASFPGGVIVCRNYGQLEKGECISATEPVLLPCPGALELPAIGIRVICEPADQLKSEKDWFTVSVCGHIRIRSRQTGDSITLPGGTKSLKKLFIDHKIPAPRRQLIPVLEDDKGIIGVYGIGPDKTRLAQQVPAVCIRFEKIEERS